MYHASVPMNTYLVSKGLEVHEFTCYRLSLHWKMIAIPMQPWYPYRSVSLPPQTVLLPHGCRSLALHCALHIDSWCAATCFGFAESIGCLKDSTCWQIYPLLLLDWLKNSLSRAKQKKDQSIVFYSTRTAHPSTFYNCCIVRKSWIADCPCSNRCIAPSMLKRQGEKTNIRMDWCQSAFRNRQPIYSSSTMYIVLHILGKRIT